MGGTALRFLYGIPRFSEDLDFALEDADADYDFAETRSVRYGRSSSVRATRRKPRYPHAATVNKAFIGFPGLEHALGLSPHAERVFSVKIEVDTNPPAGAQIEVTTVRRFATLRLTHHDKPSLLAGKAAALLLRDWIKGRDVYDLVWYLSDPTWPEPNEELLLNALTTSESPGRGGARPTVARRARVARSRSAVGPRAVRCPAFPGAARGRVDAREGNGALSARQARLDEVGTVSDAA